MNLRTLVDPATSEPVRRKEAEPETLATVFASLARRWRLIAAITGAGAAILLAVLIAMPPIYTAEATLELKFFHEDGQTTVVSRQVASMDPGALVNGAADRISSRPNLMRAAKRLRLDERFREQSPLSRTLADVRHAIGISGPQPKPLELAAEHMLRNVKVTYKTHLYNIGIAYTDHEPRQAAEVANALAVEYLRGERLKGLSEQRVTATAELALLSDRLGVRHPRREGLEARLERINADIAAVEAAPPVPESFLTAGQFITLAEPVFLPTNQKKPAILIVGMGVILALAAACAMWVERVRPRLPENAVGRPAAERRPIDSHR